MGELKPTHLQFEPSPEVKAFIFQQIQDLEPLLHEAGTLGVFIEKTEHREPNGSIDEKFLIRLVVSSEGTKFEARGESANIFEACLEAKTSLKKNLAPFLNAVLTNADREELVNYYTHGGRQVH